MAGSIVGVAALLAGCSQSSGQPSPPPKPAPAVLTGSVYPCTGAPGLTHRRYDELRDFITVYRGGRLVAHRSGHGTMTYRFTVAPGRYVLAGQPDTPTRTVRVGPHQVVGTDLAADCS